MGKLFISRNREINSQSLGRNSNGLRRSTNAPENQEMHFVPCNGIYSKPEMSDWLGGMPESKKQLCIKEIQMTGGNRFVQDLADMASHNSANPRPDRLSPAGSGPRTHMLTNAMQNRVGATWLNQGAIQRKTKNLPDESISKLMLKYFPKLSKPEPDPKQDLDGSMEHWRLSQELSKYKLIEEKIAIYNGYNIMDTEIESLRLHLKTLSEIQKELDGFTRYKEFPRIGDTAGSLRYATEIEIDKVQQQVKPPKPKEAFIEEKKESPVEFEMIIEELSPSKLSIIRDKIKYGKDIHADLGLIKKIPHGSKKK
ncbi:MAG: hypothetical protein EHM14_08580 [Methanothrix sp.]|nr:MAG: hypothetical protein EHM14_08580 [Methanothrix sp.]